MHENIHAGTNMQMTPLQRPRQRHDHGRIDFAQTALAIRIILRACLELFYQ